MKSLVLKLWLFFILLFFSSESFCQISGKVFERERKEAISGATIQSEDGRYITRSDKDGRFHLSVSIFPVRIVIHHMAYGDTTLFINTKAENLIVELSRNIQELEIVDVEVNTGYQTLPKERSTGSFVHIGKEKFTEQVGSDILYRLPSITNGLFADYSTTSSGRLTIRGLSSIRGPKAPLIIVDNFPYEGNLSDINPNDVQGITVLKDAAAASIWGVRAGNGVIVITTKSYNKSDKLRIDFSANMRVGQKPDLLSLEVMPTKDFIELEEFLFDKGFYNSTINNRLKPPLTPIVEMLLARRNGMMTNEEYEEEKGKLISLDVRREYLKYLYRHSQDQQYYYMMSGGVDRNDWSISLGYDDKKSVLNNHYSRISMRMQENWKLFERLQIGGQVYFTSTSSKNGRPGYGNITQDSKRLYPYARLMDSSGNPLSITKKNGTYLRQVKDQGLLLDWTYYPLIDYTFNKDVSNRQNIIFDGDIKYRLPKIDLTVRYQYLSNNTEREERFGENSFYVRDLVNTFSQIKGDQIEYIVPKGAISDYGNQRTSVQNLRFQGDYRAVLGVQDIAALIGTELRKETFNSKQNRIYGLNESNLSIPNVDFTRQYPSIVDGSLSFIPNKISFSETATNFISVFANAAYTYGNRYTLTGSVRRDATNLFGLRTNDKWNMLWSAGLGWNISNERFFQIPAINWLRLRATYGFSGNIDPAMSAVTTITYTSTNYYNNMPFARFTTYYNPDLKWETVATQNVGVDLGLFDNRLAINLEYYRKNAKDLFGPSIVDPTSGIGGAILKNIASLRTDGFDLSITSRNYTEKSFSWYTLLNLSYSYDRVQEYYLDQNLARDFLNERSVAGIKGKPVYSLFSYFWGGLDPENGNPIGYFKGERSTNYSDIYNKTLLEELQFHGAVLPVWYGNIGNTFSYKNLKLDIQVTYKLGHYFRRNSVHYNNLFRNAVAHSDYVNRWQQPGDEDWTNVPSMVYPAVLQRDNFYIASSALVEKADHIRLQYINLSYEINKNIVPWIGKYKMKLFFNVDNVGILWRSNKYGIDPDFYSDIVPPPSRIISCGIKLNK